MTVIIGRETHSVPEWIEKEIWKMGGHTNGRPNYRLIWGNQRIEIYDDVPTNPYEANSPDSTTKKSIAAERWHLEKLHQGIYEHVWQFGYCPHTLKDGKWCKTCQLNGGAFLDPITNTAFIWRIISLLILSEQQRDKALQKSALMGREEAKKEAERELIREVVHEATPRTIKRSFDPSFRKIAPKSMGRKGIRQMGSRDIARGLKKEDIN